VKSMIISESGNPSISGVAAEGESGERTRGGKVVHDLRGNAIWDWAVATGVLAGAKAAELLCMLDDPTLAIEGGGELAGEWAGDPYNRR
jgi:ornithine cyclodeaminase/alanine dehydrogenase-like protein (mu-crystallin family)